jgi:CAI-1 autoinducer synthase
MPLSSANSGPSGELLPAAVNPAFLRERVDWYYRERVEKTWNGGHIMRGRIPGRDAVMLVSNDYLSIARHPDIIRAQADTLTGGGNTLLMSAVFMHDDADPHLELEREFGRFLGSETSILCQSGWCANTGLIQAIADETLPIYVDMFAHTSLHEGIRSAGATARPFRHNDVGHLERLVRRHGPGVVVVDSVYSTTGSVAPLRDIVSVGLQNDCVLVVDESHSLGTHGKEGEGLVAQLGLQDSVHFRTASLAKAFAGRAGLITCSERFAEYFKCTSRPAIFSSTLLPHEVAGLRATLDVIRREDWRRRRLRRNTAYLRRELDALGYNVDISRAQILALEAGPEPATMALRDALEAGGIFGSVFCAPATPNNRSLIRLSVNAGLSRRDLERIVTVCADIREAVGLEDWPSTRRKQRTAAPPRREAV